MNRIEMDCDMLAADIGKIEGSIEVLEGVSRNLDAELGMLRASWKGNAAAKYYSAWQQDREKLSDVITELKQLLMKMKYAESSYRVASRRTSEAVNELAMRG